MTGAEVRLHRIPTPEGIALPFHVATAGDRLGAFLIDFAAIAGGTFAVLVPALLAAPVPFFGPLGLSLALLVSFFLRNFYFIACEVRWNGVTPGKRRLHLRVISRDGGPLTTEAVFARNLTRELELFLPLAVLLAPGTFLPGAPGWARLPGAAWIFAFALLPLVSKDRLRCGDLAAGTLVVKTPAVMLLADLAAAPEAGAGRLGAPPPTAEIGFTREQLDIYGIRELQVLESLLHRYDEGTIDPLVLGDVAAKIRRKIGWPEEDRVRPGDFLRAFYRAQRHRLEHKMLFGHRQERKRE